MKVAYLIACHTDIEHVKRLCLSLFVENSTYFFIHADSKMDTKSYDELINWSKEKNWVEICKIRHDVKRGGFSQCKYQLSLIKDCLEYTIIFDRIVFLSGMDYPIWSNDKIFREFSTNRDREYIQGVNISTTDNKKQRKKIDHRHIFKKEVKFRNRIIRKSFTLIFKILIPIIISPILKRDPFVNIRGKLCPVFYGSSWWALTGNCVKDIYPIISSESYMNFFENAHNPDELFIQTAVFNSQYAENAFIYTRDYYTLQLLTPLHHIDYQGVIKVFGLCDLTELINSGKMFFRKAISGKSDSLMDAIDTMRNK